MEEQIEVEKQLQDDDYNYDDMIDEEEIIDELELAEQEAKKNKLQLNGLHTTGGTGSNSKLSTINKVTAPLTTLKNNNLKSK